MNGTIYTYDKIGNRTNSGYVTGTGNRTTSDGTWTYTYDDAGQVVAKSKGGEAWAYTYDHAGQMTKADKSATVGGTVTDSVAYKYDAWGNRIERGQTGGTTSTERYVVDGWDTAKPGAIGTENFDTAIDLDGGNAVTARRLFGSGFDEPVARQDAGGGVSWYGPDRLGSVRQVFDNSGAVTGSRSYSAFGVTVAQSGTGLDRIGFTGTATDGLTGHIGNDARMLDPTLGRWTTEDPIGFAAGDPNLFRYVGNGPTLAGDPSGLFGWEDLKEGLKGAIYNPLTGGGLVLQGAKLLAPQTTDAFVDGIAERATDATKLGYKFGTTPGLIGVVHDVIEDPKGSAQAVKDTATAIAVSPLTEAKNRAEACRALANGDARPAARMTGAAMFDIVVALLPVAGVARGGAAVPRSTGTVTRGVAGEATVAESNATRIIGKPSTNRTAPGSVCEPNTGSSNFQRTPEHLRTQDVPMPPKKWDPPKFIPKTQPPSIPDIPHPTKPGTKIKDYYSPSEWAKEFPGTDYPWKSMGDMHVAIFKGGYPNWYEIWRNFTSLPGTPGFPKAAYPMPPNPPPPGLPGK